MLVALTTLNNASAVTAPDRDVTSQAAQANEGLLAV
jgi:hypothetical protein